MKPPTAYALPMRSGGGLDSFDAIVVGGGPGGCLAAIGLARLGWRVGIVDRGSLGRDKCCGHCLHPRALPLLARQGLLEPVLEIASGETVEVVAAHCSSRRRVSVPLKFEGVSGGLQVSRDRLDRRLWELAIVEGVEGVRPAAATLEAIDGEHATLRIDPSRESGAEPRRWRSRLVVAADGLGSGIARQAGLAGRAASGRRFGFSAKLLDAEAVIESLGIEVGRVVMLTAPGGYLGLALEQPTDEAIRVHAGGLVRPDARSRSPQGFVRSMLGAFGGEGIRLKSTLAAGPMPWRPRSVVRGPIALVGDAAGYSGPYTGEGMLWAFESATALVEAVERHGGWTSDAASTHASRHRRIARARDRVAVLERAVASPGLFAVACGFMRLAERVPNVPRKSFERRLVGRLRGR